jgi:hypothetical protein
MSFFNSICDTEAFLLCISSDMFKPITPAIIAIIDKSLIKEIDSLKYKIPMVAIIAVPNPDHIE